MTKFQRKLAEAVEANGYVVVNVYEVPSAPRTARSMWERFGYHYSYCGPHIAISKTKEGATMAREFAKNRHRIAKFDNASGTPSHIEWYRAQMLKGSL